VAKKLGQAVPWGRSLEEYVRMFDLSPRDLESKILDCGAGPASFNAEMCGRGGSVVSCDPIYALSVDEIRKRIGGVYGSLVDGADQHRENFVWREIKSPAHLGKYACRP